MHWAFPWSYTKTVAFSKAVGCNQEAKVRCDRRWRRKFSFLCAVGMKEPSTAFSPSSSPLRPHFRISFWRLSSSLCRFKAPTKFFFANSSSCCCYCISTRSRISQPSSSSELTRELWLTTTNTCVLACVIHVNKSQLIENVKKIWMKM